MRTLTMAAYDFTRAFYAPRRLYKSIHEGRTTPSWLCVLVYCAIYMFGTLWLYFNGYKPFTEPWIVLDPEIYYLVETFYLTPLIFLMWILGAGTIHITSKLFGGSGKFDNIFRMTGYSLWAPWYLLIIVDSIHSTPEWLYNTVLVLCIALILIGTAIATRTEQKIGIVGSVLVTATAFATVAGITFTYIR